MDKSIFREKSVENITSPDSLNDYIRVVRPSLWVTLGAIIVLLVGVAVWGVFGRLDTVVDAVAVSENNTLTIYINESDSKEALKGQFVTIEGDEYTFDHDESAGKKLLVSDDAVILSMLGDSEDTRVRSFAAQGSLPEGVYQATIVVDSVKPISFVTN